MGNFVMGFILTLQFKTKVKPKTKVDLRGRTRPKKH